MLGRRFFAVALVLLGGTTISSCDQGGASSFDVSRQAVLVPPADAAFVPFLCGGVPSWDPVADVASGFDHRDVVGDATYPAILRASDATFLYLRMRLDDDPVQAAGNLKSFGWGFEFDQDGALDSYEFIYLADGISSDTLTWEQNTVQETLDAPDDEAELVLVTYTPTDDYWAVGVADSTFNGNADYFLTMALPRADLEAAGISFTSPVVVWAGTSNTAHALNVDFSCHDGTGADPTLSGTTLDPAVLDPALDPDGDGLLTTVEETIGSDPLLRDSDADGIGDFAETDGGSVVDTDGDGTIDARDTDSDADGLLDGAEGVGDTDADSIADYRDTDDDGDGIATATEVIHSAALGIDDVDLDGLLNWLDTDADADTVLDGIDGTADGDGDGIPSYLDPDEPAHADTDGDGLFDFVEGALGTDPALADSDADGIGDFVETDGGSAVDTDGDGTIDARDTDSDADGLLDGAEGVVDTDVDSIADYRDTDDDGDGVATAIEFVDSAAIGANDVDLDGFLNWLDTDADGDGVFDLADGIADGDGDGIPAYLDPDDHVVSPDTDGDGLTDLVEAALGTDPAAPDTDLDGLDDWVETSGGLVVDTDGDGTIDARDLDSDGDGLLDEVEGTLDTDEDEVADFRDDDDDGDGILTAVEWTDSAALGDDDVDDDGAANWLDRDADGDGIEDGDDGAADGDGDEIPAYLDADEPATGPDSDGDGISDLVEAELGTDPDSDDSDGDGIGDLVETDGGDSVDTDGDGVIDALDRDSDGDGLRDQVEGVVDTDLDGVADFRDEDDDDDGVRTADEVVDSRALGDDDVDGDGALNWLDADADDDDTADGEEGRDDTDGDGAPDYLDARQGGLAGGSFCAVASDAPVDASGWLLFGCVLVVFSVLRRTARRRRTARPFRAGPYAGAGLAALLALTAGARAGAQEGGVTLDQYRAAETSADGFAISRPDDLGHLRFSAQLHLEYANDPLVYEQDQGDRTTELTSVVEHQLVGHFAFALGLIDRLVVFAGLPVSFLMIGDDVAGQPAAEGTNAGDLYLGLRGRIWGDPDDLFAIGAQATVTAPTAGAMADPLGYAGEQSFTGHLEVLGEFRLPRVRITLDLGARFRDPLRLETLTVGHELTYGLGLTVNILDRWLLGLLEVYGATTFERFANRESSPLEALLGAIVTIGPSWRVGVAAGPGLTRGYGSPDVRVVLNVGYTYVPRTEPEPGDRDGDGIRDDEDQCPDDAEDFDEFEDVDGCPDPDNDHDGILDANDQCPLQPEDIDGDDDDDGCPDAEPGDRDGDGILDDADQCPDDPEDRDEFEDENGCPDPDNDQDGVLDVDDQCPTEAEDRDQFEDENGCPDPDNDQDTVPDATDQCPIAPGRPEDNGCPRTIRVEGEQIVILQRIEFATDSDRLLPRSLPILEEVRAVLAANPQLGRIRIEGHTDSQGGDAHNLDLSRRRAETVKRWLVDHGIGEARLTAEGFGETRAIADNATPAGRQQNRRVEFHILH